MLYELIVKLYGLANGKQPSAETRDRIVELLEENDLDQPQKVPGWLLDFFGAVVAGKPKGQTPFAYDPSKGDTANFLAELQDIITADWDDYGEDLTVTFNQLGMKGIISSESNYYEVAKLP